MQANTCLIFIFESHVKTVEAPQTHACWQCLWKLHKCCYKICALRTIMSAAPNSSFSSSVENLPEKLLHNSGRSRMMVEVDSRRGLSNFFVDWCQRWLTMATWKCSLMSLLPSESWKLHDWFRAAPGVHCSQARTETDTIFTDKT